MTATDTPVGTRSTIRSQMTMSPNQRPVLNPMAMLAFAKINPKMKVTINVRIPTTTYKPTKAGRVRSKITQVVALGSGGTKSRLGLNMVPNIIIASRKIKKATANPMLSPARTFIVPGYLCDNAWSPLIISCLPKVILFLDVLSSYRGFCRVQSLR